MPVSFTEDAALLVLRNRVLEVAFRRSNGTWFSWRHGPTGAGCFTEEPAPSALGLTVGGHTVFPAARNGRQAFLAATQTVDAWDLEQAAFQRVGTGGRLILTLHSGVWRAAMIYEMADDDALLQRDVRLEYLGEGELLLRSVDLPGPDIGLGSAADCRFEAPGKTLLAHFPMAELPEGALSGLIASWTAPDRGPSVVGIQNPAAGRTFLTWFHSETEPVQVSIARRDRGDTLRFTNAAQVADRFQSGHAIEFGRQYWRWVAGSWRAALQDFQRWYGQVGWTVPDTIPGWARNLKTYEVHVGPKWFPDGNTYEPFPSVGAITERLSYIRDLGFNAVQLMPHFPFPAYTVHDYHDIDTQYGDRAELVELVQQAHALGLKVLLDLVVHGVMDKTAIDPNVAFYLTLLPYAADRNRYLDEYPEWFMRDEYGQLAMASTYAFNAAHPGWQRFVVEALKSYVTELDVDGFRIDGPIWNAFPNWDRAWTAEHRASSCRLAVIELLALAERELKALKPDCILYSEGFGPLWARASDCCYNYDEQWLLASLAPVVSPRGFFNPFRRVGPERSTARQLAEWLEERRLAYPAGTIKVHHLDSHDTHEWGALAQFRKEAFGEAAARALFAVCAWIDGGVHTYVGAEAGSEDFYRAVLHWRDRLPALHAGSCDYTAVRCSDEHVFTPLRHAGGRSAVPVIRLHETAARVTLDLSATAGEPVEASHLRVRDVWRGAEWLVQSQELAAFPLQLQPWDVRLLVIEHLA